jgi:hypothetical protein
MSALLTHSEEIIAAIRVAGKEIRIVAGPFAAFDGVIMDLRQVEPFFSEPHLTN